MSGPETWARLNEAFDAISALPPSRRDAELRALATRDPELARQVETLLVADARADAVLQRFDGMLTWSSATPNDTIRAPHDDRSAVPMLDPLAYADQTLGPYQVREMIGSGGMGVVYRAEDTRLGRSVALKFLLPQYALDEHAKTRFLQEARAASSLDHPNVCTVFGVGETDRGYPFLAMAYYDGETLKARLARSAMSVEDAARVTHQILLALGAAHDAGVVHRDLKPANVMLLTDGSVRILDFGLAKVGDATITAPGLRAGTVAYMSPEQIEGRPVDHRTDLWSLGVVLYEMLAGQRPFGGGHEVSTIHAILHHEPGPPSRVRPDRSSTYDGVVHRLLRKSPDDRYASAAEALRDLDTVSLGMPIDALAASRSRRWLRPAALAGAGGTVALIAVFALMPSFRAAAGRTETVKNAEPAVRIAAPIASERSVAVLPFADLSPKGDQAYFSEGITEEILDALVRVPGLRVPARTSSFSLGSQRLTVREIGRQLGVATVLEGSVRREANRVRITAQLIDARSDTHLWSQTFDRDVADVFAVQTEIARTVTNALRVRLVEGGVPALPTVAAHDLYLQGRFHWNRRSPGDLRRAIGLFEEAARADSTYARAFAGLAMAYASLPVSSPETPIDETLAKAERAANRAIALDSSLADGYAALGYTHHWQWRWTEAERAFRRATELDPTNAVAHQWYGEHLVKMGRGREAVAEVRQAVLLDPLSPIAQVNLGLVLFLDGRLRESIAELEKASRMDPSLPSVHLLLHRAYLITGDTEAAESEGRRGAELIGMPDPNDYVTLTRAVRAPTMRSAAHAVLDRWAQRAHPPWPEIAMYEALLGERDRAIDALARGLATRSPMMTSITVAPWLGTIRDDPRFVRLVRAMNLPASPPRPTGTR